MVPRGSTEPSTLASSHHISASRASAYSPLWIRRPVTGGQLPVLPSLPLFPLSPFLQCPEPPSVVRVPLASRSLRPFPHPLAPPDSSSKEIDEQGPPEAITSDTYHGHMVSGAQGHSITLP